MGRDVRDRVKIIKKPAPRLPAPFVPMDIYVAHLKEMTERMHQLEQKTSKKLIRQIAEAAYQKQEQRLNRLRDECVRVLSLLRDKGVVTQDEINEAVRNG